MTSKRPRSSLARVATTFSCKRWSIHSRTTIATARCQTKTALKRLRLSNCPTNVKSYMSHRSIYRFRQAKKMARARLPLSKDVLNLQCFCRLQLTTTTSCNRKKPHQASSHFRKSAISKGISRSTPQVKMILSQYSSAAKKQINKTIYWWFSLHRGHTQ